MRYKSFLKYPIILCGVLIVANAAVGSYISNQFDNSLKYSLDNLNDLSNNARTWENISAFLLISLIIAFIILLIPRISCLFLKIEGIKKDMILYKSIHKDEIALLANEINAKVRENNFSSYPY